jgi:hypothetical protein
VVQFLVTAKSLLLLIVQLSFGLLSKKIFLIYK